MDYAPNIFASDFSVDRGALKGEPVARQAGAELLGATVYELEPGADVMPLHVHHAIEELLMVLSGSPTLRTLEGERELRAGEVVSFPRGRRGAHTVVNRSGEKTRYVMLSTRETPEVVEYPELGTLRVMTRLPFEPPSRGDDPADRIMLEFDRSTAKP